MPTKIAVIGLRGFPDVMGGVETHCEELYSRLPDSFEVVVYARKRYCQSKQISKSLKVKSLYSPKKQSLETPLHTLFSLLHCFFFCRVDIVHIHGIGASIFLPLAKLMFSRVVVTHHSQNYEHHKWGRFAKTVFKLGEYFALKGADVVLFVSKTLLKQSRERLPTRATRFQFMANGFSLPDIEKEVGGVDGPFFLGVGRLVPEKGFHDLVEAFNNYDGPAKLVIAGEADFVDQYALSIKNKADDRILFLGKREKSELKWLYSNCVAFIMPSYSEGLPISALEAVSCGAPVILSNIVQNKDLGFPVDCYFPLGNTPELSKKLEEGGKIVSEDCLSIFDWGLISDQYVKLLESN